MLAAGQGVLLASVTASVRRNDHLMRDPWEAIALPLSRPAPGRPRRLCLDKGYDPAKPREIAAEFGFTLLIAKGPSGGSTREAAARRTWGEEATAKRHHRART